MRVTDGVYAFPTRVELGDREATLTPTGVETDDGLLLVDTGLPDSLDALADAMHEDGFGLDDVSTLLLTHQDFDHAGAAAELADCTGASVLAHRADADAVAGREDPIKGTGERYPPVGVAIELAGGERLSSRAGPVNVVETPGHTPGNVSLHLPDAGVLVAGDALTAADGDLDGPPEDATPDPATATRSVAALAALDYDTVVCYHGGVTDATPDDVAAVRDTLRGAHPGFDHHAGVGRGFLRRELDAHDVGLSRFSVSAGDTHGSREGGNTGHYHTRQEELYLFLTGRGTLRVDDHELDVEAGDAVRLDPDCARAYRADEDTDFVAAGAPIEGDDAIVVHDFW